MNQTIAGTCDVAYKEWAGVCRALGTGTQTVLLRKGGIAEDRGTFRPDYPRFWLYPTNLHQEQQGIRESEGVVPRSLPSSVALQYFAEVEAVWWVDRIEIAALLRDHHVWTDETVRKRFLYRTPGLWVLSVRVSGLPEVRRIPESAAYVGCKTWVALETAVSLDGLRPALTDAEARGRRESLARLLPPKSDQG